MAEPQANKKLIAAAQSYYSNGQFSDFTIACDGREFKVHRCFIALHSKFFEKSCSGMFEESQQRKIDLKEDDLTAVKIMVKYFYTFDYADTPAQSEISPLGLHARVYTVADKYEVLALKSIALERFRKHLRASCTNGKAMVEATLALDACRPLPICNPALHDLMIEAWLLGGKSLLINIGEAEASSLLVEVAWLPMTLAIRMLKSSEPDSLRVRSADLLTEAERLEQRKKAVFSLRYRLQRGFLPKSHSVKEEEMPNMNIRLGQLESYGDIEASIIKSTSISKILRSVTKPASIPKDEEFRFKKRSARLLKIYTKRMEGDGKITQSNAA